VNKRLVALASLMAVAMFAAYADAGRGNIYSAKAIKALEGLINSQSVIGAATDSSGNLVIASGKALYLRDGTVSAPSLAFAAATGHGFYRAGSGVLDLANSGNVNTRFTGASIVIGSAGTYNFTAANADGTIDTRLGRDAAATFQMGVDVNGAAVAQTLKAHDGITGTDIAGANITLAGGRGTGAGAGGNVILQAAPALATGTTAQTLQTREVFVAKAKALTAANATAFVIIAIPSGGMVGGTVEYSIQASDGTDHQSRSGILVFTAVNKADTETCTLGRSDGGTTVDNTTDNVAVSSGTLTNTFTCAGATNSIELRANAASSLTETTLQIVYSVRLHANVAATTVTPQ
jgi:hypothetical protein